MWLYVSCMGFTIRLYSYKKFTFHLDQLTTLQYASFQFFLTVQWMTNCTLVLNMIWQLFTFYEVKLCPTDSIQTQIFFDSSLYFFPCMSRKVSMVVLFMLFIVVKKGWSLKMCEWNGGGDFLTPRTKMLCNSSKPALPSVHMDLWENKRVNERTRWSILEADVVNECPPGVTDFVAALEVTRGLGWSSGQAFRNLLVFFIYEVVMLWNSLSLLCLLCSVFCAFSEPKGKMWINSHEVCVEWISDGNLLFSLHVMFLTFPDLISAKLVEHPQSIISCSFFFLRITTVSHKCAIMKFSL